MKNLEPGLYVLGIARPDSAGIVVVNLLDSDVEGVSLQVSPRISVHGRLAADRPEVLSNAVDNGTRVTLQPYTHVPNPLAQPSAVNVNSDGSFTIDNLLPIDYRLSLSLPQGLYIKEARLGKADALNQSLHIGRTDESLEITIGAGVGQIDGVVRNPSTQPVAGAAVVLVPNPGPTRPDLYKRVVAGANGAFHITNVAPGDYTLFAWEDIEPFAWFDPDLMQSVRTKGRSVRVAASATISGELIAIPAIN